jgi:SAM-dependent methyltransferase
VKPTGVRAAYNRSAEAWDAGPAAVYSRLAAALVARAPVAVSHARVLDLGAGTGAAGRAALDAGAREVVGVDLAEAMVRRLGPPIRGVHADACHLPLRADAVDRVGAAASLGHLPDPVAALRDARRVGTAVLASAFAEGWTHPAKAGVDAALAELGFVPPPWYVELKREVEPKVDGHGALAGSAAAAGYEDVRVAVVQVETGLDTPAALAAWRLGMAHLAPFVQTLTPPEREQAIAAAEAAVQGAPPLVIPMVVLAAR